MGFFRKRREQVPLPTDVPEPEAPRRDVLIDIGPLRLPGDLVVPRDSVGIVVFAHGSGSSRLSPRNVAVAEVLNGRGIGTLLFDLLTPAEADDRTNVFDIELLADRLAGATGWLGGLLQVGTLPVAFFGASTGAAAALVAAARLRTGVTAVVSRGGRPDLAGPELERVLAPTLLIVGGADTAVLELNREAARLLRCENRIEVVPGATHLFEEPGKLERVAELAGGWFAEHFGSANP